MAQTIFNRAFSHISEETRSRYGIEDADLLDMVTKEFYDSLNNPEINSPVSMLESLEKEQGIDRKMLNKAITDKMAQDEAEDKELRILAHMERIEKEGCVNNG